MVDDVQPLRGSVATSYGRSIHSWLYGIGGDACTFLDGRPHWTVGNISRACELHDFQVM